MIIIEKSIYLKTLGQYIFYLNSLKYVLNQASSTLLHCRRYDHKVGRILDLVSLLYNHSSVQPIKVILGRRAVCFMLGWIGSRYEAGDTKENRKSTESHP